jgi:HTH-type transcriptional regulator, cell division transcriptional repressor
MQDSLYQAIDGDGDTLGGRISLARDALDLSVEDTACVLGVEAQTWANWENDRSEPRANRLSMLAGVLQVSLSWLLTGHGHGPDWEELTEVPPLAPNRLVRMLPAARH